MTDQTEKQRLQEYIKSKNYWGGRTENRYIHYETVNGEEFSFPLQTVKIKK